MTVERDIAGFALPFMAGIIVSACLIRGDSVQNQYILHFSLLICSLCLLVLLQPGRIRLGTRSTWTLIILCAVSCGLFTGLSDRHVSASYTEGFIIRTAEQFCERLSTLIGSVPYPNQTTGSLLTALVTGDRSSLPAEITEAFRGSGASHILALSGLHLGIFYSILKPLLSPIGHSRTSKTVKSIILTAICGLYTLATGAGASLTRAYIFIVITEASDLTGRHRSTGSLLLTALTIQLILIPSSISDIGFQLSYAAMAAIAYIYPYLKRMWPQDNAGGVSKVLRWVWNCAAVSIACQITTGPIAWYYFGTFPKYFILTNLISLPAIEVIIPMGLVVTTLEAIGICPEFLITATDHLADVWIGCIAAISGM